MKVLAVIGALAVVVLWAWWVHRRAERAQRRGEKRLVTGLENGPIHAGAEDNPPLPNDDEGCRAADNDER